MTERRPTGTATVLFTDLVGSTELMARLGDVGFDRLRVEHFIRLQHAVEAHGGERVKNTGDGILVRFSSAVDALEGAVALQQAADTQARTLDVPISIRVGLAIGEVGFEDGDVFGTPVVEAARLVAAADPGQILCTALLRALAGSRASMPFTDLGPLPLKGFAEPVAACAVGWAPLEVAPAAVTLSAIPSCFEGRIPAALATCSAEGVPNVVNISQVFRIDDTHVAASNQFFGKTTRNLAENPFACAVVTEPGSMAVYRLQLRFTGTEREGDVFETLRASIDGIAALTGMEDVFRLRGADLYDVIVCERIRGTGQA